MLDLRYDIAEANGAVTPHHGKTADTGFSDANYAIGLRGREPSADIFRGLVRKPCAKSALIVLVIGDAQMLD